MRLDHNCVGHQSMKTGVLDYNTSHTMEHCSTLIPYIRLNGVVSFDQENSPRLASAVVMLRFACDRGCGKKLTNCGDKVLDPRRMDGEIP